MLQVKVQKNQIGFKGKYVFPAGLDIIVVETLFTIPRTDEEQRAIYTLQHSG